VSVDIDVRAYDSCQARQRINQENTNEALQHDHFTTSVLELRRRRRGQPMQPGSEIVLASLIMPAFVITALLVATLLT